MNWWFAKRLSMSQPPAKLALGVPKREVSGLVAVTAVGMEPRGKNQILMAADDHSMAKTPPPLLLKLVPYEVDSAA